MQVCLNTRTCLKQPGDIFCQESLDQMDGYSFTDQLAEISPPPPPPRGASTCGGGGGGGGFCPTQTVSV